MKSNTSSTSSTPAKPAGRRRFLQRVLALLAAAVPAANGWAALHARPATAFAATDTKVALKALYGADDYPLSAAVRIGVASRAENGAVVPVKVDVDLPEVTEIALLATRNPVPLIGRFVLSPRLRPFIATRVKLAETCDLLAVVRTPDGVVMARQTVEVTVGGCG